MQAKKVLIPKTQAFPNHKWAPNLLRTMASWKVSQKIAIAVMKINSNNGNN